MYCYDVGSNQIIHIEEVLADVLKYYNYDNKEEVVETLESRYSREEVIRAIDTIHDFNREHGGFILQKKVKLRFPFDKLEYQKLLDSFLSYLILDVTEDCNFRCKYCSFSGSYAFSRNHNRKFMTWETAREAIDFFMARNHAILGSTDRGLSMGFYGGEPLLRKELILKSLDYLESSYPEKFSKFKFLMTTNGSLLDENTIKELIKYNFFITVSLDGPPDIHNRYRVFESGNDTHDTIRKNLKLLESISPAFFKENINFSVTMAPEFKFVETIDYLKKEFPYHQGKFNFSMVDPFDTTFFDHFDADEQERTFNTQRAQLKADFIEDRVKGTNTHCLACYFKDDLSSIHERYLFQLPDIAYPNGICPPGLQRVFVDADGNLHICEKGNHHFPIGNIKTGFDVDKIFLYIDEYIKTTDSCENCWAIRFCKDCYLTAIRNEQFSRSKKKINCKLRKKSTLDRMKMYIEVSSRKPDVFLNSFLTEKTDIINEAFEYIRSQK